MRNIFEKLINKLLPFVLCICIVSGAAAPAYASQTTPDLEAQYLWDLSWTTSSNPSGKNNSWYGVVRILLKDIFDKLSLVQSDQRNLWTYNSTSYRLKNFTDNTSLSESYYINNGAYPMSWLLNSMANLSQNTGYTANQLYNSNSNLNNALNAMVSLNTNLKDYTSVLNNIKSNTDNLSGIKTDTSNLSGIKTDTSYLSGIKTDTANLSGIKTDTSNLSKLIDIKDALYNFTGNPWGFVWRTNVNTTPTLNYPLNDSLVPLIKFDNNKTQYQFTYGNKSIQDFMDVINKNLVAASSFIRGVYTDYPQAYYNFATDSMVNGHSATSVMDLLKYHFDFINLYLGRITNVIADPQTIAAKKANQGQENSVLTNFTGSGAASASVSDFGAVKDSMVSFKAGFSGGASSSDTFGFLSGDSNAWDWFTQQNADSLDTTQRNNTRLLRGTSDVASDTPLLDAYYNSIMSVLGGVD